MMKNMYMLQKTKKKLSYALAIMLGSLATFFVINKDNQNNGSGVEYKIINKANADLPYSQGYYESGYGGGDWGGDAPGGSDSGSDSSGGGGGGVSDEYT